MQKLVDLALAPVIVYHAHVSMNCIISDYVPKPVRSRLLLVHPFMICFSSVVKMGCSWSQRIVSFGIDKDDD